ncbi:reverse transcriptase domain-containing protein [uncultured Christiangramia sp.]|uniref:reverse transcriptase domain-containing protein n=1 Tax=uncultured Christiangramia sp. TaxID=503836 RepID=UPI0025EE4FA7|nr:reverse transcriptase domain-containing protein [uncultured Christiangramia sp.]|tara:strand:+ start:6256 stop:7932 length:1677 start_codon:yes stop_codon:yes gene_type:complete
MSGIFSDQKLKQDLKSRFQKINDVGEFISFLNFFERNSIGQEKKKALKPITEKEVYHLSKTRDTRYDHFEIPKKNGNNRDIKAPDRRLKRIQGLINEVLQVIFEDSKSDCTNGFLYGRDIRTNAEPHINKNFVLNLDIENFFPSIEFRRIKTVLELQPFDLSRSREPIAFLIANICTLNGMLPQGSPASPILSNIVTQKLDRRIQRLCFQKKVKYTRYADDLTFSSNRDVFDQKLIKKIEKIIKSEKFQLNYNKTRLRNSMERQEVTGLIVNRKVNIKRKYLQKTRAMLNNWEKGGLKYAEREFQKHQPVEKVEYDFREVLLGHLSFIRLIKGETKYTDQLLLNYYFLYHQINYDHIKNSAVKTRLRKDNVEMEKLLSEKTAYTRDEIFIAFCTSAFHQVENLINYYYYKKYPVLENLLQVLIEENPFFKSRYKRLEKAKKSVKKISDLNINVLIFLYEKEFYFDKGIFYDKKITKLRRIRNDKSHRCEVIDSDKPKIISEYQQFKKRTENLKNYSPTKEEEHLVSQYEVIRFLEEKNFKKVRGIVNSINENIKNYFA